MTNNAYIFCTILVFAAFLLGMRGGYKLCLRHLKIPGKKFSEKYKHLDKHL